MELRSQLKQAGWFSIGATVVLILALLWINAQAADFTFSFSFGLMMIGIGCGIGLLIIGIVAIKLSFYISFGWLAPWYIGKVRQLMLAAAWIGIVSTVLGLWAIFSAGTFQRSEDILITAVVTGVAAAIFVWSTASVARRMASQLPNPPADVRFIGPPTQWLTRDDEAPFSAAVVRKMRLRVGLTGGVSVGAAFLSFVVLGGLYLASFRDDLRVSPWLFLLAVLGVFFLLLSGLLVLTVFSNLVVGKQISARFVRMIRGTMLSLLSPTLTLPVCGLLPILLPAIQGLSADSGRVSDLVVVAAVSALAIISAAVNVFVVFNALPTPRPAWFYPLSKQGLDAAVPV